MFQTTSFRRKNRRAAAWRRSGSPQAVECLEVRTLLAGNMAVSVVDGVLMIRGDNQANEVSIRLIPQTFTGAWPGATFEIRGGINPGRPTNTAINGQRAQETIQVSGVDRGVNINLGGGDDQLFIGSGNAARPTVNLPGTVFIDAGAGDDDLKLYATNRTDTRISGGYGDDTILLGGGPFFQLAVQTNYGGVDNPNGLGGSIALVSLTVNGPTELRGSPGREDIVISANTVFNSRLTMNFGNGNNVLNTLAEGQSGARGLPLIESRGPIFVIGGTGRDFIELNNALAFDSVSAFLGAGDDLIRVSAASGVTVELNVSLGVGNNDDAFLIGRFTGLVSGGDGDNDELARQSAETFGEAMVIDFESIRTL